jgi:hypothetical protein
MTDGTGRKNRPGAGSFSLEMHIEGVPLNCYLNNHPKTGRVEIVKMAPRNFPDQLVKDFASDEEAWAWARNEFTHRRLP